MRILRRFLIWFFTILIVGILLLILTGNQHILYGVQHTYLIGRTGPEIDDMNFFPFVSIPAKAPQEWEMDPRFGKAELTAEEEAELNELYTVAFLVVKDGKLLYENYWDGWNADSTFNSFSVAKSVVSTLTGIAIDKGHIQSVFDPVSKYLPEYAEGEKAKLNLRHLLTMSTGLDYSESGGDPFSSNAKAYYGKDLQSTIDELEVDSPIGEDFVYISGSTQIMGWVLEAATGKTLDVLANEWLWTPLGNEHDSYWGKDREDGTIKSFCCHYSVARDFARLGQLYLDGGKWKGEQIVSEEFVSASLKPAKLNDKGKPNTRYGFFWWLHPEGDEPFYYARGYHGQFILVIPSERMVIVRGGYKREQVNPMGHPSDIFRYIEIAHDLVDRAS